MFTVLWFCRRGLRWRLGRSDTCQTKTSLRSFKLPNGTVRGLHLAEAMEKIDQDEE